MKGITMNNHMKTNYRTCFLIVLLCWTIILSILMPFLTEFPSPITVKAEVTSSGSQEPELKTFADLSGKTVAMLTGAPFEELVLEKNPDVKEIQYFSTPTDMVLALKTGKIDAFLANNAAASMMVNQDSTLAVFPESLEDTDFGFAFKKGDPTCETWQAAFDSLSRERIEELWDIWIGTDESKKIIPEQDWEGKNGIIKVGSCDNVMPLSYVAKDGKLVGLEIALMLEMAKEMDVHLEFIGMDFSAVLPALQSGKVDVVNPIAVTEERQKMLDMVSYRKSQYLLVVRAAEQTIEQPTSADGLKASFECTFITDSRWKMILLLKNAEV